MSTALALLIFICIFALAIGLAGSFIGTTGDEFSVHFKFDEGKILKSDERWPFDSKIIDRDGNVMESKLAGDIFRPFEVADHLGAVDFYR